MSEPQNQVYGNVPSPPRLDRDRGGRAPGWVWAIIVIVVLALAISCVVGVFMVLTNAESVNGRGGTTAPASTGSKTAPKPLTEKNKIDMDGILVVNKDVVSGTYTTTVPEAGFGCYYARLKNTSGDAEAIISNNFAEPKSKVTVTIATKDGAFQTSGCGTWVKR